MGMQTLKEISMKYAKKQPKQVEYLTEGSPILDALPFDAASHGYWNAYEEVTDITGPSLVKMDAPLPKMDVSSDLRKVDLDVFGGQIEKGEDAVKVFGGFSSYVSKKEQPIMRKFGQDAEKRILYQYMRRFAIENNGRVAGADKLLFDAGGTGNKNYSILAVRYEPGVCCGLFNPEGFGQGAMMNYSPINGGNLYKDTNGILVYGGRWKSNMGFQIASPRNVAACVNINREGYTEANWKLPTAVMIDDLLSAVRAESGNTFLYMHEDVLTALGKFKEDKLQTNVSDKMYDRLIDYWGKIPIITSYNFMKGTETDVTVS